jgi:putative SOS response-associated peptidase YedK
VGLIPYWCQDPTGGRKPINAKYETVWKLPTFHEPHRERRCIVPVDRFFEREAIKGQPLVLAPADYARWLGEEPDPPDLMRPFRLS